MEPGAPGSHLLLFFADDGAAGPVRGDLQLQLGRFCSQMQHSGMIINTSTLRHCFSAGKSWFLALRERNDFLPQVKKLRFLWILFMSCGRLEQETARQTDVDAVPLTERVGEVVTGRSMFLTYELRIRLQRKLSSDWAQLQRYLV